MASGRKHLAGVGQNLWDQAVFGATHRVNVLTASASFNNPALGYAAAEAYLKNATGPLSSFGGGCYGFEKLPEPYRSHHSAKSRTLLQERFPADWPEVEYLLASGWVGLPTSLDSDPADGNNYAHI